MLRVVFWFWVDLNTWPIWLSDLIYILPSFCQCATFSLLILFYIRLVDPKRWPIRRANAATVYFMANFLMLAFTILYSGVNNNNTHTRTADDAIHFMDEFYFCVSGIFFGLLVILALYFVARLYTINSATVRLSKRTICSTSLVFLVFLSRCIFDFLFAFGGLSSMHVYTDNPDAASAQKALSVAAFLLFMIWEVLPTAMVLIYFRKIPSTNVSMNIFGCLKSCFRCCDTKSSKSRRADTETSYDTSGDADDVSPVLTRVKVYHSRSQDMHNSEVDHPLLTTGRVARLTNTNSAMDLLENDYENPESANWDKAVAPHSSSFPDHTDPSTFLAHVRSYGDAVSPSP